MNHVHTVTFPRGDKQLVAVLVHGLHEHCGRYGHVVEAFQARGYGVVTGDLPGHGRSGGRSGHVETFDEFLEAVEQWVRQAEQMAGDQGHVVLIGHSMGGLTVIRYLQERTDLHPRLVGAALSSPLLKEALEVPAWKRKLADTLRRIAPRFRMSPGIAPDRLSRDPQAVAIHRQDKLIGSKISLNLYHELMGAMSIANAAATKIGVPVLLMQAGQDVIVDPQVSEAFYQQMKQVEGSKFVPYQECYHELFQDLEREQVIQELLAWLAGIEPR